MLLTTPAVRALRQRFPAARLTYLVEREAAAALDGNPSIDEIAILARNGRGRVTWGEMRALVRRLRAARYDVAIDFHGGPRSAWLTFASGAPTRIGYASPYRWFCYTHRIARSRELRPRHSVLNQWDLLAPLGIVLPPAPENAPIEMADAPFAARQRVDGLLRDAGVSAAERMAVVHIGAGNAFRTWPAESFALAVDALQRQAGCRVVLVGNGAADRAAEAVIQARSRSRPVSLVDRLDLAELRELIARAAVYVGGDTGPIHVAATTRTPIVALFGPTRPETWGPWRPASAAPTAIVQLDLPCRPCDQRRCLPGDFRCLRWIAPEAVVAEAERLLAGSEAAPQPTELPPREERAHH